MSPVDTVKGSSRLKTPVFALTLAFAIPPVPATTSDDVGAGAPDSTRTP